MSVKRIVVIGASTGGVEALRTIAAGLPADFGAAVCLVIHRQAHSSSLIGEILERAGPLPARDAVAGERLAPGRIYIAPPDHHLLIEPGVLRLSRGPRENRSRPAIDPLFRSAAQVYGPAAIGVILTGELDDGAAGLDTIRRLGGGTVVQDPADALAPSMPTHALRYGTPDFRGPLQDIPALLVDMLQKHAPGVREPRPVPRDVEVEVKIAGEQKAMDVGLHEIAEPSLLACPECHGVLMRLKQAYPARFRCHTGHAYSSASLVATFDERIEDALWGAVRAIEETSMFLRELAEAKVPAESSPAESSPPDLAGRAREHEADAAVIRELLTERAKRAGR